MNFKILKGSLSGHLTCVKHFIFCDLVLNIKLNYFTIQYCYFKSSDKICIILIIIKNNIIIYLIRVILKYFIAYVNTQLQVTFVLCPSINIVRLIVGSSAVKAKGLRCVRDLEPNLYELCRTRVMMALIQPVLFVPLIRFKYGRDKTRFNCLWRYRWNSSFRYKEKLYQSDSHSWFIFKHSCFAFFCYL